MNSQTTYTYTILRYVHDIATGEVLNVGVALYSPDQRFINVLCRTTYKRLRDVFPSLDGDAFRSSMRHVVSQFEAFSEQVREQLDLQPSGCTVMQFAHNVLAKDDSSLQWSAMGAGLTRDPAATLEQLFERMVMCNDLKSPASRKVDDDVWRQFSVALQQRQILKYFEPKTIAVQDDEIEFKHAWKNGVWHCLAPVSFDLASADSIKDKAHKWLGQLTSVRNAGDVFRMYFLVGSPTQIELTPAFDSAVSILRKSPVDIEIYRESEAEKLTDRIVGEVEAHLSGDS